MCLVVVLITMCVAAAVAVVAELNKVKVCRCRHAWFICIYLDVVWMFIIWKMRNCIIEKLN